VRGGGALGASDGPPVPVKRARAAVVAAFARARELRLTIDDVADTPTGEAVEAPSLRVGQRAPGRARADRGASSDTVGALTT
jgi:hypothetical protein